MRGIRSTRLHSEPGRERDRHAGAWLRDSSPREPSRTIIVIELAFLGRLWNGSERRIVADVAGRWIGGPYVDAVIVKHGRRHISGDDAIPLPETAAHGIGLFGRERAHARVVD